MAAASTADESISTACSGNRSAITVALAHAIAPKPPGYDGYGGVGMYRSRSGSTVIGRAIQ
jgi:hypothetical protein